MKGKPRVYICLAKLNDILFANSSETLVKSTGKQTYAYYMEK